MTIPRISIKKSAKETGAETDPLFDDVAPPAPSQRPRVTCLVCGLALEPDRDKPSLCVVCGADLPVARAFVTNKVLRTELLVERTHDAWTAALDGAEPALQARWAAFYEAQEAEPERAQAAVAMARSGRADPLLDLLRLFLAYQDAGEQLALVNAWVDRCAEVLG